MIEIKIKEEKLDCGYCVEFAKHKAAGGIATFIGTVRNQTKGKNVRRLEFESYIPMAEKKCLKLLNSLNQNGMPIIFACIIELGF
ncbi:MAG: molybdenum cofactor biosynthesis protein MoaE [Cytophagales bacterium]